MTRTTGTEVIDESTTAVYTATIKDENGVPIPLAQITALTLTLFNTKSMSIINTRDDQNVLNANGVVIHPTSGLLTWNISPEDTVIENDVMTLEARVAQFIWTYGAGKRGSHERVFYIRNLEKVS